VEEDSGVPNLGWHVHLPLRLCRREVSHPPCPIPFNLIFGIEHAGNSSHIPALRGQSPTLRHSFQFTIEFCAEVIQNASSPS